MTRAFVIDPVCVMNYGHSLNAIRYFANVASGYFQDVLMVASAHLPIDDGADDSIIRYFDFHYDYALKIRRTAIDGPPFYSESACTPEGISSADFSRFIFTYDVCDQDTFLFPSIDYYSLMGLLNALNTLPPQRRPRLLLRFIGVMESASQILPGDQAMPAVIQLLREAFRQSLSISICAETPKYAETLSSCLEVNVMTVPYLAPDIMQLPLPSGS